MGWLRLGVVARASSHDKSCPRWLAEGRTQTPLSRLRDPTNVARYVRDRDQQRWRLADHLAGVCSPNSFQACLPTPWLRLQLTNLPTATNSSEGDHLVRPDRPGGELIHARPMDAWDERLVGHAAGVDAGATRADLDPLGREALEHPLEVVVAVGGLLGGLGCGDRVAHQEDPQLDLLGLGKWEGQPQPVVGPLVAVGGFVEDDENLHG